MSVPQPIMSSPFYTIPETAKRLKVSPKTVRRWIESGRLSVHRFGRQIRIADADLAAYIESCRR